jgi:hypothetical protein
MCILQLVEFKQAPEISCVYKITHETSGRSYIGRTCNLKDRLRKHWQELVSGKHKNPKILNTYKKYGGSFLVEIIEAGTPEYCEELEGRLLAGIDLKNSLNCHRSNVGGWRGLEWSEESRKRLSDARKGKPISAEAQARAVETRKTSEKWAAHQARMQSKEATEYRVMRAALPEVRAKAVATRRKNYGNDFFAEPRKRQIEKARQNIFQALDWAAENNATRGEAIKKFGSSWGSLKKFLPEWEEKNGKLDLPLRASGPRNGNYKGS